MTITKLKLLKNNLIRSGVSYKNACRYVRELEHHYDDLFVEAKSRGLNDQTACYMAEEALGDEQQLLNEMVSRPELQGIDQRFPKLYYLVLPAVLFLALCIGLVFLFIATMGTYFDGSVEYVEPTAWLKTAVECFRLFLMHGLAPFLSLLFLYLGMRHQISRKLLFGGIFLVNLIGCALLIRIQWPDPAAGFTEGSLGASFGYGLLGMRGAMDTKYRLMLTLVILSFFGWGYRRFLIRE